LQKPNTVYPPDRAGYLSTASFIIPIAEFRGVGHPKHLRPNSFAKRYVADADWAVARGLELELSRYKAGLRELQKKKLVYKWTVNRNEKDRQKEWAQGFRRSGELVIEREKLVL
jgi:hypothetical protein